ncbi:MAG: NAD(P)-dependent oxidoreductase [Polyangia bacterium]
MSRNHPTQEAWSSRANKILITGSEGLVGTALRAALEARGEEVVGLDLVGPGDERGDVRIVDNVRAAIAGCRGVVHLAAVSRVILGERNPRECEITNIGGLRNVVEAAQARRRRPWLLFASSREVYGQPEALPVSEDAPLRPCNVYGRTKVEGERIVGAARDEGLRAAVARLSNVYGTTRDHEDRVVPAFARAAVLGEQLRVDGTDHTFDFTHIDDTTRGLVAFIDLLDDRRVAPPPVHLLTGRPTTLGELATMAIELAGGRSTICEAPPRSYDVSTFYGDPARARELLHWRSEVSIREGLGRLIGEFRRELLVEARREVAR